MNREEMKAQYGADHIDWLLQTTLKLTPLEKQIVVAFLDEKPDSIVAKELGLKRNKLYSKRQNIYSKIGYQIMLYQQHKHTFAKRGYDNGTNN